MEFSCIFRGVKTIYVIDDINSFYSSKDAAEFHRAINEEHGKVLKYCAANMLTINISKRLITW